MSMPVVKWLDERSKPNTASLGGKGYALGILTNRGFNVPPGFVIVSDAFLKFLLHNDVVQNVERVVDEMDRENFTIKSDALRRLVFQGEMPPNTAEEVKDALGKLKVQHVAVRSSAVSEDSQKASFAGLHDTYLNVESDSDLVLDHVKRCWASLFSDRAVIYRIKKWLPLLEGMAVIVQKMIPAEISGIALTVHPTRKKALLVEAAYGLGDMIVGGEIRPDTFVIDRATLEVLEKDVAHKTRMSVCKGSETEVIGVEREAATEQAVSDSVVKKIARACLEVEAIFEHPQGIEWCVYNGTIYLLQSRPSAE